MGECIPHNNNIDHIAKLTYFRQPLLFNLPSSFIKLDNSTKVEFLLEALIVVNENIRPPCCLCRPNGDMKPCLFSLHCAMQRTLSRICLGYDVGKTMIKVCKSCGKEFQNLTEGVLYSSFARGVLEFCSDDCSKNYLNSAMK